MFFLGYTNLKSTNTNRQIFYKIIHLHKLKRLSKIFFDTFLGNFMFSMQTNPTDIGSK